jgi:CheY-like chemotaxis protein
VFDAFFTTKPVGVGTGLGLYVCHGIVQALGGSIDIESELGAWTRVRVVLPLAGDGNACTAEPATQLDTRRGRILVVDDEPMLLSALCRLLEGHHHVTGVASGQAALDLLRSEPFDIILCDLMMPGMNGVELYALVAAREPELCRRIVFMTGGTVTEGAAAFVAQTSNRIVDKPFDVEALLAMLRELLAP